MSGSKLAGDSLGFVEVDHLFVLKHLTTYVVTQLLIHLLATRSALLYFLLSHDY